MKVYNPIFKQYEEVTSVDIKNGKVYTLFRGHLGNVYDIEDVEFMYEDTEENDKGG